MGCGPQSKANIKSQKLSKFITVIIIKKRQISVPVEMCFKTFSSFTGKLSKVPVHMNTYLLTANANTDIFNVF